MSIIENMAGLNVTKKRFFFAVLLERSFFFLVDLAKKRTAFSGHVNQSFYD